MTADFMFERERELLATYHRCTQDAWRNGDLDAIQDELTTLRIRLCGNAATLAQSLASVAARNEWEAEYRKLAEARQGA